MYVVTSGEVEITLRGKLLETVRAGSVFGEMALIGRSRAQRGSRSEDRRAGRDHRSQSVSVPYAQRPDVRAANHEIITNRLRRLNALL